MDIIHVGSNQIKAQSLIFSYELKPRYGTLHLQIQFA